MKLILTNRERLGALGSFVVDEFDSLIARIRGAWKVEHTDEGQHGNVHAETIATGRVVFSDIVAPTDITNASVDNYNPAGLDTAALLRLTGDAALTEVSITGLQVPLDTNGTVLDGRTLVIENNDDSAVFAFEHDHTSSSPRNRFLIPHNPTVESTAGRFFLFPKSLVILVYNATLARWLITGRTNDEIVSYNTFGTSQDDYAPNDFRAARVVRLVPTAAGLTLSGFDSTGVPVPAKKTIVNEGLYALDILHRNTGSVAAYRVGCPGSVRYRLNPRESIELYRDVDDNWYLLSKADQFVDVVYSAGNFTASAGSWTVASGDVDAFYYHIDGNKMTVVFELTSTSVSAAPLSLNLAIPNGRVAARPARNALGSLIDAGTALNTGQAVVVSGGTVITIYKDVLATAWTTTAGNNTGVYGQITFMVRDDSGSISEVHTDVSHGDTVHADADHSDVAHVDGAHADTHSDTAHDDAMHSDVAHVDVTHVDVAHEDVAHDDTAHADEIHNDSHDDHNDQGAFPDEHGDSHGDQAHADDAHADTAHSDTAHADTAHSDTAHSDGTHADTAHADTHSDTPHSDTAHTDASHGDTAHADSAHQDVGFHTDTAHADI